MASAALFACNEVHAAAVVVTVVDGEDAVVAGAIVYLFLRNLPLGLTLNSPTVVVVTLMVGAVEIVLAAVVSVVVVAAVNIIISLSAIAGAVANTVPCC